MQMTVQQWMNSPDTTDIHKPFLSIGDIDIGLVRFDADAKIRCWQSTSSQKNRRVEKRKLIGIPPQGKSRMTRT